MNMKMMIRMTVVAAAAASAALGSGCAMFRANVQDVNVAQPQHLNAGYDFTDLRKLSETVATDLVGAPFLGRLTEPPVMMIAGVQNRTKEYLDTKNLTDRMRSLIFPTGRMRFVNESRRDDILKEQGFSAQNATPESQAAVGKILGAKFMISGSLTEMDDSTLRQARVSKTKIKYYKLTVEVSDIQSSELMWTKDYEIARAERTPLIGW